MHGIPVHERVFTSRTRLFDFENRVHDQIRANERQTSSISSWLSLHRHANQGTLLLLSPLIKACADKLVREMEQFGPNFEKMPTPEALAAAVEETSLEEATKSKAKKGKVEAKAVPLKYQAQIMMSIGIPKDQVSKFADAAYWLKYFPPVCQDDCSNLGLAIDWRRSFITTDANPFYDSFVRWQMNRLHEMGKIKFGERYTIFSVKDGQPCMDHDRQSGEGVGPQEYTAIKLEAIELAPAAKEKAQAVRETIKGKRVFFVAATLRPETMYGQTCCFVGPKIEYGMFVNGNEVYICTPRAAKNMAYTPSRQD
jgi:leucyl-tRNA synthetase